MFLKTNLQLLIGLYFLEFEYSKPVCTTFYHQCYCFKFTVHVWKNTLMNLFAGNQYRIMGFIKILNRRNLKTTNIIIDIVFSL